MAVSIIGESNGDAKAITKLVAKETLSKNIKAASVRTLCQKINMYRLHDSMTKQASPSIDLVSVSDVVKLIGKAKGRADKTKEALSGDFDMSKLIADGKTTSFFQDHKTKGFINKAQLKSAAEFNYSSILNTYDNEFSKYLYHIGKVNKNETSLKKAFDEYVDYEGKVPDVIKIIKESTDNKKIRNRLFGISKTACTSVDIRKYANNTPSSEGYVNWADPFPSKILEYIKSLKSAAEAKMSVLKIEKELKFADTKLETISGM